MDVFFFFHRGIFFVVADYYLTCLVVLAYLVTAIRLNRVFIRTAYVSCQVCRRALVYRLQDVKDQCLFNYWMLEAEN